MASSESDYRLAAGHAAGKIEGPLLEIDADQKQLFITAYEAWLERDRVGAMAAIEAIPEEKLIRIYERTLGDWAVRDGDAARAYADALADPALQEAVLEWIDKITSADP